MPERYARKGAFWHVQNPNIIPRKIAANGAPNIIDASRLWLMITLGNLSGMVQDNTALSKGLL